MLRSCAPLFLALSSTLPHRVGFDPLRGCGSCGNNRSTSSSSSSSAQAPPELQQFTEMLQNASGRRPSFSGTSSSSSSSHNNNNMGSSLDPSSMFNGHFADAGSFLDVDAIKHMQSTLQQSMSPELRESMSAMMNQGGGVGGSLGMMAFGVGENERGKKVARAATLSYDLKTGKVNKDFMEQQMEDDDVALPRETVHEYRTDDAMEVEFVESVGDGDGDGTRGPAIGEGEIEIEMEGPTTTK